jgi:ParB family chromosome partitioning protein
LAASIREHGIIQPLLLTANPLEPGKFWIVAGERRWRAARLAEFATVPAIVRDASPEELVELALVENLQRADLNPLEEASAYQTLIDEFTLTQAEIGQRVGKSRSAIANTLRLLQLPRPVQEALSDGRISAGHARALLALPDPDVMSKGLARILDRALSVRQTEEYVKQLLLAAAQPAEPAPAPEEPPAVDTHLAHLENRFRAFLGTRVNLARNKDGSGRLIVHFYSDEDLNNLYQLIAGDEDTF